MNRLVEKWRDTSRAAAEEVFAGTRDRINRMGGVGAWNERQREQRHWRPSWALEDLDGSLAKQAEKGEQWDDCADQPEREDGVEDEGSPGASDGDVSGCCHSLTAN